MCDLDYNYPTSPKLIWGICFLQSARAICMYVCMYVYGPPMGTPREAIIKGYCSIGALDTNQYSTLAPRQLALLVYT